VSITVFAMFSGAIVIGFAYTIRRIIQVERRHDALCDVLAEQHEEYLKTLTNFVIEDIEDNLEE
jgi:hypothetical protein